MNGNIPSKSEWWSMLITIVIFVLIGAVAIMLAHRCDKRIDAKGNVWIRCPSQVYQCTGLNCDKSDCWMLEEGVVDE